MFPSAYDLKSFYNTLRGRILRRLIREHILEIWPACKDQRMLGYGYAVPYLKPYLKTSERSFAVMPQQQGVHEWPVAEKNLVCLSTEKDLPLETNSIDRVLMIHSLEFSDTPQESFQEIWRVLKSSGRLLLIVPNRLGLWSRADWTPFGQGRPYSAGQLESFLRDNLFTHERTRKALFAPAFRSAFFLRSAGFFEKFGRYLYPALGGVHLIEASKQLYAGTGKGVKAQNGIRVKKALVPEGVTSSRNGFR